MADHRFQMALPPQQAAGVFADFIRAWHTKDSFILDFAAFTEPAVLNETTDELVHTSSIVARVRIPPSQVFELMKALEQQLSAWEKEQGRAPSQPGQTGNTETPQR
ncbi:MAG: DUF3467 domain-containing protein [Propionibacteriaceae bacterium]|jgi:hypothetical protein|nr:DUF3467 domain-containing protein [Propionibacteriaceae bacterium]